MKPHFKLLLDGTVLARPGGPNAQKPMTGMEAMCTLIRELHRIHQAGQSPLPTLWMLHDLATTSKIRLVDLDSDPVYLAALARLHGPRLPVRRGGRRTDLKSTKTTREVQ